MFRFPKGFLFGSATSAHQVEGNNANSDWCKWEKETFGNINGPKEESGIACDSYNKFEEDFKLVKDLGQNAHRLSLEWARIEPEEGKFSKEETEHYRNVLLSLREKGIKTFVTLHHFTNPIWFSNKGGFLNSKAPFYFCRYSSYIAKTLGDLIDFFVLINEPNVLTTQCYLYGFWPPQEQSLKKSIKVFFNLAKTHNNAYKAVKKVSKNFLVGVNNNIVHLEPFNKKSWLDKMATFFWNSIEEIPFFLLTKRHYDFISINYYFYSKASFRKLSELLTKRKFQERVTHKFFETDEGGEKTLKSDMGWNLNPRGLYSVLKRANKYHKPIYVAEYGLADSKDKYRSWYLKRGFHYMKKALEDGINLKGFFVWSLLDNYEWHHGFGPKFGLVEVDRKTLKRTPRPSAYVYKKLIEANKS